MAALGATYPTTARDHHLAVNLFAPAVSLPEPAIIYSPLAEGAGGTWQTLAAMQACVLGQVPPDYSGYQDEFNISAADAICANAPGQEALAQIAALFKWVTQNITYEPHPFNQQICQDARRTLELRKGDCVSLSVLLATLLACVGYQSQFVTQFVDGEDASHVYVEVFLPSGETLALDAVADDKPMGWRQPTLDGGFEVEWPIFT